MRRCFAYMFLSSALLSSFSHAESLDEIYQQALQNDHTYKAAQAAYASGLENRNIGLAGLLPQINAEVNWSDGESDTVGIERNALVNRTVDSSSSGYSLVLTQPLFDMAAWHSYKKGKVDSKAAEAKFKAAQQALIIRTAAAYFDALSAVDNFETAKAEENANSHQLEQTRKRFEVGLTAITEVHEAQASYDNSLARRLLLEGQVGIAFEALEVITGQPYQHLSPLKVDFPIASPSPIDRQEWVKFATANNFTLAASSLSAESLRQLANNSKAAHFPKITSQLSYSDTNRDDSNSDLITNLDTVTDNDTDGYSFRVTLSIPLFSGGGVSARRKQTANNYLEAKEKYFQTQRDTVQIARSLHLSVLTDVATVKARKQAIKSNQSAVEATQAGYEVGTRDLVDVLVSQRALYAAQSNYSDALYTYVLDTLKLKEVAGLLTEKDISDLDAWLDDARKVSRSTF